MGKSILLFTDKILRRREMYYDVTIDVMHVELVHTYGEYLLFSS